MPPKRSSASSGTRKKHAKKALAKAARVNEIAIDEVGGGLSEEGEQREDGDVDEVDGEVAKDYDGQAVAVDKETTVSERIVHETVGIEDLGKETPKPSTSKPSKPPKNNSGSKSQQPQQLKQLTQPKGLKHPKQYKDKEKSKGKFKEPKVKQYIPPPSHTTYDPVDTLDVKWPDVKRDRVEVWMALKRVGKRDERTVERGVSELLDELKKVGIGAGEVSSGEEQAVGFVGLEGVIDVWVYYAPQLLLHASRKVRSLATTLQSVLISSSSTSFYVSSPTCLAVSKYIGSWCLNAFDTDKSIRQCGLKGWNRLLEILKDDYDGLEEYVTLLVQFLDDTILSQPTDEMTEESEEERVAETNRVVSAVDALSWLMQRQENTEVNFVDIFGQLLENESLWDILRSRQSRRKGKRHASLGKHAPTVRSALWQLFLKGILSNQAAKGFVQNRLDQFCQWILPAAWEERETTVHPFIWLGLLRFLKEYPEAWVSTDATISAESSENTWQPSPILSSFFNWLKLGCNGNPVGNYPIVIVILSTLPHQVFPITESTTDTFLAIFYSALNLGSLDTSGLRGFEAFTTSFLECFIYLSTKLDPVPSELVQRWLLTVWEDSFQSRLSTHGMSTTIAQEFFKCLNRLKKILTVSIYEKVWEKVLDDTSRAITHADDPKLHTVVESTISFASVLLRDQNSESDDNCERFLRRLMSLTFQLFSRNAESSNALLPLATLALNTPLTSSIAFKTDEIHKLFIDGLWTLITSLKCGQNVRPLLELYAKYLTFCTAEQTARTWEAMVVDLFSDQRVGVLSYQVLGDLTVIFDDNQLLVDKVPSNSLDDFALRSLNDLLNGQNEAIVDKTSVINAIQRFIIKPRPFVDPDSTPSHLLILLTTHIEHKIRSLFSDSDSPHTLKDVHQTPFSLLERICATNEGVDLLFSSDISSTVTASIFLAVHFTEDIVPRASHSSWWKNDMNKIWQHILGSKYRSKIIDICLTEVVELLQKVPCKISPFSIYLQVKQFLQAVDPNKNTKFLLENLLPQKNLLEEMFNSSIVSPSEELTIFEPLLVDRISVSTGPSSTVYSRYLSFMAHIFGDDPTALTANLWCYQHIALLGLEADDHILGGDSTFFDPAISNNDIFIISQICRGVLSNTLSIFASNITTKWHETMIARLRRRSANVAFSEPKDLDDVIEWAVHNGSKLENLNERRILAQILIAVVKYAELQNSDLDRWLAFAQNLAEKNPFVTNVILYSIKDGLYDSPRFERYQNELVSKISSIPTSKANTSGVQLLRTFCLIQPPPDAPYVFVSPERTLALIETVRGWIDEEDDLDEEVQTRVMEIFVALSPIIQTEEGDHWDFLFDLLETNIEMATWEDPKTFAMMWHSLRLFNVILDLTKTNKRLKSITRKRVLDTLEMAWNHFLSVPVGPKDQQSKIQIKIIALMADILNENPLPSLIFEDTYPKLLINFSHPTLDLRRTAYQMSIPLVRKRVEEITIEAELDKEDGTELFYGLPVELVEVLKMKISEIDVFEATPQQYLVASKFLFQWMSTFDFVDNASHKIKMKFTQQLRSNDLISEYFLPSIFNLIQLGRRERKVHLSLWKVEEFWIDYLDIEEPESLSVFAAHVLYRSLEYFPSLIRTWWEDCKDRTLSFTFSTLLSKHFSPLLITRELSSVQSSLASTHQSGNKIQDEEFTVKVIESVNEVKAVYVVDEQKLEISVGIPNDWPLQIVQVREVRKIGVREDVWRAWILAVQQIVNGQNGMISDALSMFKRNVSLHFEGVEACAICYSIINVNDRSLPTKTCRTCKNKFHAACLFTWFNTSHGSSCPLCRSLF